MRLANSSSPQGFVVRLLCRLRWPWGGWFNRPAEDQPLEARLDFIVDLVHRAAELDALSSSGLGESV